MTHLPQRSTTRITVSNVAATSDSNARFLLMVGTATNFRGGQSAQSADAIQVDAETMSDWV